ncbi:6939_t:CDS:1, partial [Racocetra persica]
MAAKLPYLCLHEIFEYTFINHAATKLTDILSCIYVNRNWYKTAIPILWRDPFNNNLQFEHAVKLIDVYIASFPPTLQDLLNLPSKDLYTTNPSFNYAKFLRRMNLTQIRAASGHWLKHKNITTKCPIFEQLCTHFVNSAQTLRIIEFNPEVDAIVNMNIFTLPNASTSLCYLNEFACYGEPINNLYATAANVVTRIKNLRISLVHGCPIMSTTLNDMSTFIRSQKQLEKISVDNRIGCFCCPQDLSLALDLTNVFSSLGSQAETLLSCHFFSINFHNDFPLKQLAECQNLQELIISRCWDFGIPDYTNVHMKSFTRLSIIELILSTVPDMLIKTLLIQSGKSLRKIKLEQHPIHGTFSETLQCCAENNQNITNILAFIYPEEIYQLPMFLSACQQLEQLEIWDKNTPNRRGYEDLHYSMRTVETINVNEILSHLGAVIPCSL